MLTKYLAPAFLYKTIRCSGSHLAACQLFTRSLKPTLEGSRLPGPRFGGPIPTPVRPYAKLRIAKPFRDSVVIERRPCRKKIVLSLGLGKPGKSKSGTSAAHPLE